MSVKRYFAETCPDFEFFWPNGVPADAKRWCLECIHLANSCPTKEEHDKEDYRCEIHIREVKRLAWLEANKKGQVKLLECVIG
jgi:hypothetical protein